MRNCLFVLAGRPGAGKSTLADLLGEKYDFVRLDKDDPSFKTNDLIAKRHAEFTDSSVDFWETDECKKILEPALYKEVFERAHEILKTGKNCVVDGPLLKEAEDARYLDFIKRTVDADALKIEVVFFWVIASREKLKSNIFNRNATRDHAKMANWENYVAGVDLLFRPAFDYRLLDTTSRDPKQLLVYVEQITGLGPGKPDSATSITKEIHSHNS